MLRIFLKSEVITISNTNDEHFDFMDISSQMPILAFEAESIIFKNSGNIQHKGKGRDKDQEANSEKYRTVA